MTADSKTRVQRSLVTDFLADRSVSKFRRLHAAHAEACWRLALHLVGDPVRAEEIVQEAWTRIVKKFATFEGRSSSRTWILGFVVNCAREHRRNQRQDRLRLVPLPDHTQQMVDDRAQSVGWRRIDLLRALDQLSGRYREVILLHDVEGHTHAEIAAILAIEEGTSKSQLSRGRKRLRELLQGDQSDETQRRA